MKPKKSRGNPSSLKLVGYAVPVGALVILSGCMSMRDHPAFDSFGSLGAAQTSYSEAYVEFPGPQERWGGPRTWVLHVKAATPPEITVSPAMNFGAEKQPAARPAPAHDSQGPQVSRLPASETQRHGSGAGASSSGPGSGPGIGNSVAVVAPPAVRFGLTPELVRERIGELSEAVSGSSDLTFRNCLSPVRVRLVRADNVVIEKRGCRQQSAWSKKVSAWTSEFLGYVSGQAPSVVDPPTAPITAQAISQGTHPVHPGGQDPARQPASH